MNITRFGCWILDEYHLDLVCWILDEYHSIWLLDIRWISLGLVWFRGIKTDWLSLEKYRMLYEFLFTGFTWFRFAGFFLTFFFKVPQVNFIWRVVRHPDSLFVYFRQSLLPRQYFSVNFRKIVMQLVCWNSYNSFLFQNFIQKKQNWGSYYALTCRFI